MKASPWCGYAELFRDNKLLPLLGNSLEMALLSSLLATVMGTAAALGIHRMGPRLRSLILTVTNIPMTNPDIVTGVSLSLLFVFIGAMMRNNTILGFWTLLIAHVTFNLPYVILNVMPKLTQMDPALAGGGPGSGVYSLPGLSGRSPFTRSCPASSPAPSWPSP